MARHEEHADEKRKLANAARDAVERKIEVRMQQHPRGIGDGRHQHEAGEHKAEEPCECAHFENQPSIRGAYSKRASMSGANPPGRLAFLHENTTNAPAVRGVGY